MKQNCCLYLNFNLSHQTKFYWSQHWSTTSKQILYGQGSNTLPVGGIAFSFAEKDHTVCLLCFIISKTTVFTNYTFFKNLLKAKFMLYYTAFSALSIAHKLFHFLWNIDDYFAAWVTEISLRKRRIRPPAGIPLSFRTLEELKLRAHSCGALLLELKISLRTKSHNRTSLWGVGSP